MNKEKYLKIESCESCTNENQILLDNKDLSVLCEFFSLLVEIDINNKKGVKND